MSSNLWQIQHEHLLQKESSDGLTALQAKFLQIQVVMRFTSFIGSSVLATSFVLACPFVIVKLGADCFCSSVFLLALTGGVLGMSSVQ